MGFLDFFKKPKPGNYQTWRELGEYNAYFSAFGADLYKSDLVRSCIRPLADFSGKAEAKCSDHQIEQILNNRPNMYMNGRDFLYKVRTRLELQNTVFIYIQRDERLRPIGFYPVPCESFDALEYNDHLFIRFHFTGERAQLTLPWEDLAVLRKDYNRSDIAGDRNGAIFEALDLVNTSDQGAQNAIKSTANLRGILKSTKAMLSTEDVKKQKDAFVKDYLNLENEGGIASLDATQEFIPIKMEPVIASYEQMKEFRERVYRYYGVNDDIIMGSMDSAKIEAFYELRIEPFLVALSRELTSKVYSGRAQSFGNWIVYEANKLQFASLDKKITLFKEVVLYGGMTINEWRAGCNMAPLEGGDEPIRRLDAAPIENAPAQEEGEENNEE